MDEFMVGGMYSVLSGYEHFLVVKVLNSDESGVEIKVYGNRFTNRPVTVDSAVLSVGENLHPGIDHSHVALSHTDFRQWKPIFISQTVVTESEQASCEKWKKKGGKYLDTSGELRKVMLFGYLALSVGLTVSGVIHDLKNPVHVEAGEAVVTGFAFVPAFIFSLPSSYILLLLTKFSWVATVFTTLKTTGLVLLLSFFGYVQWFVILPAATRFIARKFKERYAA